MFPLAEVREGMTGHGYTVFRSTKGPERFDFVVLGVMRGYLGPGEDLIIAQLTGERIERTGVISGMSGSPAYIDGKLVGAVGYRFGSFTKDAIAGITPIERMLTARDPPVGVRTAQARPATKWGGAEPIATPVMVTGIAPSVLEGFAEPLAARGLFAVPSASTTSAAAPGRPERLYAAGPIAGALVSGDVSMTGIGTVTWVKGDRFLAFGHSFRQEGLSVMPVFNADIVLTVASDAGSWKMGQATHEVGRLTDDRLHAIAGTMNASVPTTTFDIALQVEGPRATTDARPTVSVNVLRNTSDTPLFCAITLANTLTQRVALESGATVDVTGTGALHNGETFPIQYRVAVNDGTAYALISALTLLSALTEVVSNGFDEVLLDAVHLDVAVRSDSTAERIVGATPLTPLYPGSTATVQVRTLDEDRGLRDRRIVVAVPAGVAPGAYRLIVAGQDPAQSFEMEAGLVPVPVSLPGLLEDLRARPAPGSISVYLTHEDVSQRVEGASLAGMPDGLLGVLEGAGGAVGGMVEQEVFRIGRVVTHADIGGRVKPRVTVDKAPARETR